MDFSNSLLARASFNGAKLANATLANVELTQASFLEPRRGVIGRPLPTDCGDLAFNCPRFDDLYNGYIIATGVNLQVPILPTSTCRRGATCKASTSRTQT